MLPNFIVIGAQKSASTFLQFCLDDHPDIYMPTGEIPFFETPDYENSQLEDLEKHFNDKREPCLGIKRPNYIGKPEVPINIQKTLPNAKLIAVLRNPIDRAVSAYFHNIKYGFIPALDVEIGLRKLISDESYSNNYKRASEILEFGKYNKYLRMYDHYLSNNQLLLLLHEDIVNNPLKEIQKAYKFLSVDPEFVPKSLNLSPQKVTYNVTRLKFLVLRNRFMFEYIDNNTRILPKKMNAFSYCMAGIITVTDRYLLSSIIRSEKPKLSYELKAMLREIYSGDIHALESLLGRDLSAWLKH